MTSTESVVRRARARLMLLEALSAAIVFIFWLSVAAAMIAFAHRLVYLSITTMAILFGASAAGLAAWLLITRQRVTPDLAARRVDDEFRLQERMSTALAMAASGEEMLPALQADAERHACGVDVSRFRFKPPRQLHFLPLPLLALAVAAWLMPPVDLLGRRHEHKRRQAERDEVRTQAREFLIRARELKRKTEREKLATAKKYALKMEKLADDLIRAPKTKHDAMVKMSKLADDVREARQKFERAREFNSGKRSDPATLGEKIEDLGQTKDAMKELADALRDGKLDDAAKAFDRIAEQMKNGGLTPEEARKLGEAMMELAKNLPQNEKLAELLRELGKRCASCNNAGDFADLLEQVQLTQAELAELEQLLAELQACDMELDLLEYQQMCLACKKGKGKNGKPLAFCLGGNRNANSAWLLGMKGGKGGVALVPTPAGGRGKGERPTGAKHDVDFLKTKAAAKLGPGVILASQFVRGMPPDSGEARQKYEDVIRSARKMADDAVHREDIPPQCREKIKQYFDDLQN